MMSNGRRIWRNLKGWIAARTDAKVKLLISAAISSAAILLLLAHVLWPQLAIDGTVIALLVLAALPWLGALLDVIELPGGVKIRYKQQLDRTERDLDQAEISTPAEEIPEPEMAPGADTADPRFVLDQIRLNLERRLQELYEKSGYPDKLDRPMPLGAVTVRLLFLGMLTQAQGTALQKLLPVLYAVSHGAELDTEAASRAIELGRRALGWLDGLLAAGRPSPFEQAADEVKRKLCEAPEMSMAIGELVDVLQTPPLRVDGLVTLQAIYSLLERGELIANEDPRKASTRVTLNVENAKARDPT